MNCKDAVERLVESSSRFRVQGSRSELRTLNSELRTKDPALASHIEACPACAKEAEDLARLFSVLREADEPSDASAAVLARRIVARLGEKEEQKPSRWALQPVWGIAVAAAAAVVLIIWIAAPGGRPGPESPVAFHPAPPERPTANRSGHESGALLAFVDDADSNEMSAEEIREARITLASADADLLARDMVDPADVYRVFALLSEEDKAGLLSALSERRSSLVSPDTV